MRFLFAVLSLAAGLAFTGKEAGAFCLETTDDNVTVTGTAGPGARYDQGTVYYFRIQRPSCATTKSEVVGVFGEGDIPCPEGSPVTVTGKLTHVISPGALYAFGTAMNFMRPESVACR